MSAQPLSVWLDLVLACLFPVLVYTLWRGPTGREYPAFKRHFEAQKYLRFSSDLFLVMLAFNSIAKLGFRLGYLPASAQPPTMMTLNTVITIIVFATVAQHIAAFVKTRRERKGQS